MTLRAALSAPFVTKGSDQSSLFELRLDRVKNDDVTLKRLAYENLRLV